MNYGLVVKPRPAMLKVEDSNPKSVKRFTRYFQLKECLVQSYIITIDQAVCFRLLQRMPAVKLRCKLSKVREQCVEFNFQANETPAFLLLQQGNKDISG
ncbi:hypothetical protein OUZ56_006788 [Daphnia magna]|uniref:Uncharacterized protein n=1 Tax=Daphnia magna TaxID=35525 RepID=A0ABQ9YXZ9_9CRUS|nr:hypothetical protein OUZ56_006788 [Daphnia magna]